MIVPELDPWVENIITIDKSNLTFIVDPKDMEIVDEFMVDFKAIYRLQVGDRFNMLESLSSHEDDLASQHISDLQNLLRKHKKGFKYLYLSEMKYEDIYLFFKAKFVFEEEDNDPNYQWQPYAWTWLGEDMAERIYIWRYWRGDGYIYELTLGNYPPSDFSGCDDFYTFKRKRKLTALHFYR